MLFSGSFSFLPFPVLETSRLLLRRTTLQDASDIFEMRSDPEVMKYIPRPIAKSEEDVFALIHLIDGFIETGERINWAIELKENGKVLGLIGYVNISVEHQRAEVGYSLNRSWHRKGIVKEALKAVLDFGFANMKLHTVNAIVDAENTPSASLLENVGFRKEAHFLEDFLWNGNFRNSIHYGILNREWENNEFEFNS